MPIPSKVKPGDPIRASDWNALLDFVRASQVSPGAGVRMKRTASGTTLAVDQVRGGGSSVSLPQLPFEVVLVPGGDEPTLGVVTDSHVMSSVNRNGLEEDNTIWGLWSEATPENAFGVPAVGGKIWLECSFDSDNKLVGIAVKSGAVGEDEWSNFPDPIEINTDDTPYQEYYRQVIAEVTDPDSDKREGTAITLPDGTKVKLVQLLKSNLLLVPAVTTEDADQPGLKVSVAIPFSSPWTGADGGAASIVDQPDARTPWEFGSKNAGEFPFQVLVRSDPWEPDAYVFGVRDASLLLNSFDYEDTVDIDGLLVEDSGWVSWNGDFDLVWLELEWDDWPDSYTASIKSFSNGDEWESGEIETDGEDPPTQTKARIVLAVITVGDTGNPVVEQRVRTHLQVVSTFAEDLATGTTLQCLVPAALAAPDAVPDWLECSGDPEGGWDVCAGAGWSSFARGQADPIRAFELEVGDPLDDSGSGLNLVVGDDYGEESDMLCFTSGSDDAQNKVLCQWVKYPLLELSNDANAGLRLSTEDTNPILLLADAWDDPDFGNQINLNLKKGPEILLRDEMGAELTINSIKTPLIELNDTEDHSGNQIRLNLESGPELYLSDEAGAELSINISDGPEVSLTDEDGATVVLDSSSLTLTDADGNETTLSSGNLDLGEDGTIDIGDSTFTPQTFTFFGDDGQWHTIEVLATEQDDTNDAIEDIRDMIAENIDESIRAGLESLSATIDCDSMSVTFSHSY